jgi:hypothetical protein
MDSRGWCRTGRPENTVVTRQAIRSSDRDCQLFRHVAESTPGWSTLTRGLIAASCWLRQVRQARELCACRAAVVALAACITAGVTAPAWGQAILPSDATAPADARVLFNSVAVVPTIRLTNVGWDDNVLYANKDQRQIEDFTATLTPAVQAWLRFPGIKVRAQSEVDFIYFRDVSRFRSIDTENGARVDFLFGRVRPYVSGAWANTRHRQDFEVDVPVRRVDSAGDAGVDVRLTGKTIVGATMRRSRVDYKGDSVYLGDDLARYLTGTTASENVRMRYSLTPFTTVGLAVAQQRNRFTLAPERDSNSVRVTPVVEFHPFAPVNGRVEVGVIRRTFVDGNAPAFRGSVARVDLGYTVFGRTRFAVGLRRDLSYSYRSDQRDFLQTGTELSVTHRLANAWDLRGTFGRFTLAYGLGEVPGASAGPPPEERVRIYGLDLGRYIGGVRVGLQVARQTRTSNFTGGRDYEKMRVVSSVTYGL